MTAEDIKKVNRITLTGNISNEDMKELYNFYSLKILSNSSPSIFSFSINTPATA